MPHIHRPSLAVREGPNGVDETGQSLIFDQGEVRADHAMPEVPTVEDVYPAFPVRMHGHRAVPLQRTLPGPSDFTDESAGRVKDFHRLVLTEPVVAGAVAHEMEGTSQVAIADGVAHDQNALERDAVLAEGFRFADDPDLGAVRDVGPMCAGRLAGWGAGDDAGGQEDRDGDDGPRGAHAASTIGGA